jgi:type I restriction-modification system DNA methylase subunit
MEKAEAKQEVARLVEKLNRLTRREFKKYDEENTKKDFILPLFRALGWATEDRQEVTAEDKVSRRRVDYAFRIEGIPKFFLEAKPLKADLDNPEYAWQAINYAWTKGVTWAALTDFEGLKVFNAQWKGTNLLYNLFKDIPHTGYIERFDELWLLSRQSFEKGLLDIEAEKVAKKGKREPVGKELFDDLILWRQRLYKQLRGWNKGYSEAQIDEAVQRILDRLIFIRTAEDRELEERVLLPAVREWRENGDRKELDKALVRIFREFDKEYDSELFETGHFCEGLACDSNTYALVIEGLYGMRDEVPTYNFDAIDVDVLGGIYEQYLSYRQGLPEEVEEAKRARRKKRGIYYTPKFVVQYIVENTVGRLLQERSHDEIRKLRILDPACGSGSFLIEAFDRLDRYHQEARGTAQRSDEKAAQDDFLERLRILKENIYGVDLDPQAVEIARLNLLLKTLHRRALLPKLEDNIRCGNSLISGMPIELSQYFGSDWEAKRPFNWEEEFPKIMEEDGFDIVIGNPPYVRPQHAMKDERAYFMAGKYGSAHGKFDIYVLFLERGIKLLRKNGRLSYIVPYAVLSQNYGKLLRKLVLDTCCIEQIVDLSKQKVFEGGVPTCILVLRREDKAALRDKNQIRISRPKTIASGIVGEGSQVTHLQQDIYYDTFDHMFRLDLNEQAIRLSERIKRQSLRLSEYCYVGIGIDVHDSKARVGKQARIFTKSKDPRYKPYIEGKDILRHGYVHSNRFLLYEPEKMHRPKYPEMFETDKIITRVVVGEEGIIAAYDTCGHYAEQTLNVIVPKHILAATGRKDTAATLEQLKLSEEHNLKYIFAVLASRVIGWYFEKWLSDGLHVVPENLRQLPIRRIDFDNPQDVKMHDDLVALVERMLDLHKRLKDAVGEEKKDLERQIARTDRQIDDLVYQLYGLTEEERAIIEN